MTRLALISSLSEGIMMRKHERLASGEEIELVRKGETKGFGMYRHLNSPKFVREHDDRY